MKVDSNPLQLEAIKGKKGQQAVEGALESLSLKHWSKTCDKKSKSTATNREKILRKREKRQLGGESCNVRYCGA